MAPKIDLPDKVLRDIAVEIPHQIFIPFFQLGRLGWAKMSRLGARPSQAGKPAIRRPARRGEVSFGSHRTWFHLTRPS